MFSFTVLSCNDERDTVENKDENKNDVSEELNGVPRLTHLELYVFTGSHRSHR